MVNICMVTNIIDRIVNDTSKQFNGLTLTELDDGTDVYRLCNCEELIK